MVIDSHHHFWRYSPHEYGWIDDSMSVLKRDFLPEDLQRQIKAIGVDGVVSVQARQTIEETRWLLELADRHDFIRGVVGWLPLVSDKIESDLQKFAPHPKLKAVRHVLQDEPDDRYMLRDDFNHGINLLSEFDLVYDILIFERHLPHAIELIDSHPTQVFVLDHVAKPRIRDNVLSPWRENMVELAKRPNIYCKLSGMATEADHAAWTPAQLKPYMNVALEAFGAKRLMFGSDWPVCLLAVEYSHWFALVSEWSSRLSQFERTRLMGGTATEAYGL